MKRLVGVLAAIAMVFGLGAGSASAAPVSTSATLALTISGIGSIVVTGAGTVSVSGTTVNVGANLVSQGGAINIAVTSTTAVQSITATGIKNKAGTFSLGGVTAQAPGEICPGSPAVGSACALGGGVGGLMGLSGTINIRVNAFVNIPVNLSTANIGQGGGFVTGGGSISGDAGPWTNGVGVVVVTAATPSGATVTVPVPASGTGTPLTLVSPTFVSAFSGTATLPLFASFSLNSVTIPEPGTLLLLASGVFGLITLGRSRK